MSQFGNDLYTGKTSFPFVGRRRLWFLIATMLVIGSALVPLVRPIQFSIEFTGGSQFTVSGLEQPDQLVATDAVQRGRPRTPPQGHHGRADTAIRVQTDQMSDDGDPRGRRSARRRLRGGRRGGHDLVHRAELGTDVTRQSLWGLRSSSR